MSYFANIPSIKYDFNINNENEIRVLRDITRNIRFQKDVIKSVSMYDEYDIKDGETPEIVSERVYGSPNYHWLIMVFNDIYDYIEDWPMSSHQLEQYCTQKYGKANYNAVHHYEKNGYLVEHTDRFLSLNEFDNVISCVLTVNSNVVTSAIPNAFAPVNDALVNKGELIQLSGAGLPFGTDVFITKFVNDSQMVISTDAIEDGQYDLRFIHWTDPSYGLTSKTNFEYEFELNETKRRIKLLNPSLLSSVMNQLRTLINE